MDSKESVRDTHGWDGHLTLVHSSGRHRRADGLELGVKIQYTRRPAAHPVLRPLGVHHELGCIVEGPS